MRIGLLGGSFDPVHNAHVALAKTALKKLELDEVQLIPAGQPWQRAPLGASPEHRLAMLRLAVGETPGLRINPIEIFAVGGAGTKSPTGCALSWHNGRAPILPHRTILMTGFARMVAALSGCRSSRVMSLPTKSARGSRAGNPPTT